MVGLNGSLLHRLERVEQLVPVVTAPPPELDEHTAFWLKVQEVAPPALWTYIMTIDAELAELQRVTLLDDWLAEHHPALENALEGLQYACRADPLDRLRRVQGEVVKYAYWRLGWSLARERAAGKTATCYDHVIQAHAAELLLDWSGAESHVAWLEPERFVDQWRNRSGPIDPSVLERAGLFRAELDFLNAEED